MKEVRVWNEDGVDLFLQHYRREIDHAVDIPELKGYWRPTGSNLITDLFFDFTLRSDSLL